MALSLMYHHAFFSAVIFPKLTVNTALSSSIFILPHLFLYHIPSVYKQQKLFSVSFCIASPSWDLKNHTIYFLSLILSAAKKRRTSVHILFAEDLKRLFLSSSQFQAAGMPKPYFIRKIKIQRSVLFSTFIQHVVLGYSMALSWVLEHNMNETQAPVSQEINRPLMIRIRKYVLPQEHEESHPALVSGWASN